MFGALNALDQNNDGTIDFSEFMALFELDEEDLESRGASEQEVNLQWGDIEDILKGKNLIV